MTVSPSAIEPMVLVVHVNFGVGGAIAQRLIDSCVVSLASVRAALGGLLREGGHDVLVLCPYLRPDERAALLAEANELERPLAVIEISQGADACDATVELVAHRHQERASARLVLAALTPIAA